MAEKSFSPFPVLNTERLILRKLVSSDDHQIFALRSNEKINRYLGRKLCGSIDEAKDFIQLIESNIQKNDSLYWAITLIESNELVGTICLYNFSPINSAAEIGYELLPEFQGRGIMQESVALVIKYAREEIKLASIEAYPHSDNINSLKLLEKLNFRKQGPIDNSLIKFIFADRLS